MESRFYTKSLLFNNFLPLRGRIEVGVRRRRRSRGNLSLLVPS